jgi:hypothetical protein
METMGNLTLILIILCVFALLFESIPDILTKFGEWFASEKTPLWIHTAYILILILLPLTIFAVITYIKS